MDFQDLKNKSEKELHELLVEKREELREFRFKVSEKQLKDVGAIKKTKQMIAQILTLLNAGKPARLIGGAGKAQKAESEEESLKQDK